MTDEPRVPAADRAFVRHLIREMRSAIADDPISPTLTTGPSDPDILERVLEIALSSEEQSAVSPLEGEGNLAGDEHCPSCSTLKAERDEARSLLFRIYNMAAIQRFEPDPGEPHPLKDGIWDQTMRRVNEHLQDYRP